MGLRNRGPYAPVRRPAPMIDFAAHEREAAAARANIAAVEAEARAGMAERRLDADPIAQLIQRCYAIEQRQDGFAQTLERLAEQVQTIIELMKDGSYGR